MGYSCYFSCVASEISRYFWIHNQLAYHLCSPRVLQVDNIFFPKKSTELQLPKIGRKYAYCQELQPCSSWNSSTVLFLLCIFSLFRASYELYFEAGTDGFISHYGWLTAADCQMYYICSFIFVSAKFYREPLLKFATSPSVRFQSIWLNRSFCWNSKDIV